MIYELEERTMMFARNVRDFCRELKHDIINTVYIHQLIKATEQESMRQKLMDEAEQLRRILSSILQKLEARPIP